MVRPGILARLGLRLRGLPRSPRELDRGLRLLAAYRRLGWFASGAGGARTRTGRPLPWWTYAATLWLDGHLAALPDRPQSCLELGSGSSTMWLAQRFARVTSLEHDEGWFRRLRSTLPAHVDLRRVDPGDVTGYLAALEERETWDLVVIDGLHRTACLPAALARLRDQGLVLLDDSDRPAYGEAIARAHRLPVIRTDFFGFSPGVAHLRSTSIFSLPRFRSLAEAPAFFGHGLTSYRDL